MHLNGLPLNKVYNVWAKKVQRSYISWQWRVMQNWKKTDLCFPKWHEKFGKFLTEHLKVSKLELWWDLFIQSKKIYDLKIYRVMCHDNEEWYKIWRGNDLSVQNLHEEFHEFWPKHFEVMCTLMGSFWTKSIMFELRKNRRVMFNDTGNRCNIWNKTDLCFPKWHEEFGKFSQAEK